MTLVKAGGRGSPTAEFFDELKRKGREPLLKGESGTLRFDLLDGERVEHWSVVMASGDVTVSRRRGPADAVVRLRKETFDGMVSGRVNAMAATLRGEIVPEGDLGLVMLFQRLFPGPP